MSENSSTDAKRSKPVISIGCALSGLGVCIVPVLFGSFFIYVAFVAPAEATREAADWEETPCVIVSSQLAKHQSHSRKITDDVTYTYEIEVEFRYRYGGQDYTSDRYDLSDVNSGEEDWKQEVVDKLRPGTETVCYVNPDDPDHAVLSREVNLSPWAATVPVVFVLAGLAGTWLFGSMCLDSWRKKD